MDFLEQNIRHLLQKNGVDFQQFLSDLAIETIKELSLFDLEAIAEENEIDLQCLLFQSLFSTEEYKEKTDKIKLLILDVDGVMSDGGMYMMMNGDQMKKFNTKDGLGIMQLLKQGTEIAIISSGIYDVAVSKRAEMLGIRNCYVGRRPKMEVLEELKAILQLENNEIAMIGDDINDLEIIKNIGFSACPKDAVSEIRNQVNIILQTKGGEGCVREFIDRFLIH